MFNFESGWDMKSLEPISLSGFFRENRPISIDIQEGVCMKIDD